MRSILFCLSLMFVMVFAGVVEGQEAKKQKRKPRAARSVHLGYPAPDGVAFYNEVKVEKSATGTYFMVCGFRHGYFGIQELWGGKKVVIFSVWDPGKQDNPNVVKPEDRVKVLHGGKGVNIARFGGEGTGGRSLYPYQWEVGKTYRFLVKVKVRGKHTAYSGYFYEPEKKKWKHLVTFETFTGGDYLKGYYSFVEDFVRNGKSVDWERRAWFGRGWVKDKQGNWLSLDRARFTGDGTPLLNIDAGKHGDGFFLDTGGKTKNKTTKLWQMMKRKKGELKELKGIIDLEKAQGIDGKQDKKKKVVGKTEGKAKGK